MYNIFSLEAACDSMSSQEKIGYVISLNVFNENGKSVSIVHDGEKRK